ncbi:hypothetical protein Pmar_PMAR024823 [Perkinsus marinus ATCC 50983]|uniref:Uncharacterized protein n=1 Tax=Perkinsus marinus (strain ATCC 50983 / TXsc) TaxID=423536 RepID=C5LRX1_PERM5|nr:hypothetical protein Pmar_PMAR024823 [Perkinsus marinus ATCC 50983]EER00519.1 hypothetical protein Pmar_PMAR024823 [Perkinsus marinus ATCC 50983]|eukprot:XP_002767801.1 hypothetical protein Pmar_PMAR024823 [Perkinsus marinus ATCC 50983]
MKTTSRVQIVVLRIGDSKRIGFMFISSIKLIFLVLSFHNYVLGDLNGLFFSSKLYHTPFLVLNFRADNTVFMVISDDTVDPMKAHWEHVPGTEDINAFAIHLTDEQYIDMANMFPLDYRSHTLYGVLKHTIDANPIRYIEMSYGLETVSFGIRLFHIMRIV